MVASLKNMAVHVCLLGHVKKNDVPRFFFKKHCYILYTNVTSSTAQGGGGSFKNRKPIGEVGCCESGMAERSHWWTERCLISLTLSLSFSDCLPTYLSIFYVSIYLSICLSLWSNYPIYLSIHLSIYLSIHPSIHPSIHLSIYPSIHLSI